MAEWSCTRFEVEKHVARITIDRPEVRNALNADTHYELSQHFDEVERNDDIWLAVITGAGDQAFSAGADLKAAAQRRSLSTDERAQLEERRQRSTTLTRRFFFPKPVIARVNGFALGGGLELAMACDIIVAAEHAELGLPEPLRGLIAAGGGVHRLPRQIGLKQAMGYLLTGRHMSAQRAFELGLVNQVVPLERLDEAVDEWVRDILRCSPLSVRSTKELAMRGLELPLGEAVGMVGEAEEKRRNSRDAAEGPRAFAEKRAPRWEGR